MAFEPLSPFIFGNNVADFLEHVDVCSSFFKTCLGQRLPQYAGKTAVQIHYEDIDPTELFLKIHQFGAGCIPKL